MTDSWIHSGVLPLKKAAVEKVQAIRAASAASFKLNFEACESVHVCTYAYILKVNLFLTKLLTEDLPNYLFKENCFGFPKFGKAVGQAADDVKSGEMKERRKESVGELSVTLVDA
ncbi:hypothetical protein RJT34_11775 [Clitoria ternatea]|uniref:Uncharacterized protein n=1 Tax=Clitoria ternatea TaxID=43366 RepID=A0AAN9JN60_CLITE